MRKKSKIDLYNDMDRLKFNEWVANRDKVNEGNAQLNKKIVVTSINADLQLITANGGKTSTVVDIRAGNHEDDEMPGNKLYIAKTQNSTYVVSMDDFTAKKVLSTFFSVKSGKPNPNATDGSQAAMYQKLAAQQGNLGGSNKKGSARIIR